MIRQAVLIALTAACVGCTQIREPSAVGQSAADHDTIALFDARNAIADEWQHLHLNGATEFQMASMDARIAIRAVGRDSASGLIRRVHIETGRCREIEWSWNVTQIQPDADIREKAREDVAASLFLLFGDPGFLTDPRPVPTLRYVWASEHVARDAVIDNPYMPGVVRSIVIESGGSRSGEWVTERRDIAADFETAFGHQPTEAIHAVALFTDNDQTKQAVEAYYEWARVLCAAEG